MADQKINALPVKTAPTTGDKMLMIGAAEEYQIDYDQLATAILNKLTSKTYALDQGTKTLIAALNELNSKSIKNNLTIENLNDLFSLNPGVYIHRFASYNVENGPNGYSGFVITHVHDGNNGSQWIYNLQGANFHRIKSTSGIGEWASN